MNAAEVRKVVLGMKQDVLSDSSNICFFYPKIVVSRADQISYLVEKLRHVDHRCMGV